MMNKYCGNCGHEHTPNAKFCEKCGAPLTVQTVPPASNSNEANSMHQSNDSANRSNENAKRSLKEAVIALQQGNESAFNDVYTHTYRKVCVAANTYLKNHADAEDAVQDIYIQVYNKISTIREHENAMPWIMAITRNTCLNILEKRKRAETTVDESYDGRDSVFEKIEDERADSSPESNLFKREHSAIVLDMVANLPLEQKDAVMLHYIEQRSISDIAMLTNTTASTVKSRLSYARSKLKDMVLEKEKQGIKLRVRGLFIFLPYFLRNYANTVPLSAEAAGASAAAIEAAVGISTGAATGGSATATTGSVVAAMGTVTATVVTTVTAVTAVVILGTVVALPTTMNTNLQTNKEQEQVIMQTISASWWNNIIIMNDGSLWEWGSIIKTDMEIKYQEFSPMKKMEDMSFVSVGYDHNAAIGDDGVLWTWGANSYGQLGDGSRTDRSEPIKVMDDVIYVTAGYYFTLAIKSDNTLWGWGVINTGSFGSDIKYITNPVLISEDIVRVFAEGVASEAAFIKSDNTVWIIRSIADSPSRLDFGMEYDNYEYITQISYCAGFRMYLTKDGNASVQHSNTTLTDVAYISAGGNHYLAIKTDGTLWAWGFNEYGQLGDGTRESKDEPIMILEDVVLVSAGIDHTIALKKDGTLWAWGDNQYGQLGIGSEIPYSLVPIQIMENVMLPVVKNP